MSKPANKDKFRVVCFGGSAGGLKAYREILHLLPADTGMAFFVAPHRAPAQAHLLRTPFEGYIDDCSGSAARHDAGPQ